MVDMIPTNLIETLNYPSDSPKRDFLIRPNKPYEEYDSNGNLIGYSWYQGDSVELDFHIDGCVAVETDAIVYESSGDRPTGYTQGVIGQKAYNIRDLVSWTLVSIANDRYIWQEDAEFSNPQSSVRSYYISAQNFLKNKILRFRILNFRKEPIFELQQDAATDLYFDITTEASMKIAKGTYTVELVCEDVNRIECVSILSGTDCQLFVR